MAAPCGEAGAPPHQVECRLPALCLIYNARAWAGRKGGNLRQKRAGPTQNRPPQRESLSPLGSPEHVFAEGGGKTKVFGSN